MEILLVLMVLFKLLLDLIILIKIQVQIYLVQIISEHDLFKVECGWRHALDSLRAFERQALDVAYRNL